MTRHISDPCRSDRNGEPDEGSETPGVMLARLQALKYVSILAETTLSDRDRAAIAWVLTYAQSWREAATIATARLVAAEAMRECLSEQGTLSAEHVLCRVCHREWVDDGRPGHAHEQHSAECPVAAYDRRSALQGEERES